MKKIIGLFLFLIMISTIMFAQTKFDSSGSLTAKERSIVAVSAYTAMGDMPSLTVALNKGLDAGLTISETKEILVHLYAYAGFPRSLNALHNLMAVLEERKKQGIVDVEGKAPSPVGKNMLQIGTDNQTKLVGRKILGDVYDFAPAIDHFLKEHLFGAIFSRDNLNWKTRELVTISALAAMEGVAPQLRSHFGVGMYNGLTADQLSGVVSIIDTGINAQRGIIARQVLQAVIDKKPYTESPVAGDAVFSLGQKIDNDNFFGTAWLNSLVESDSSNAIRVGNVTFEPGARTKWHLHPGGQVLLVLDGVGYYQERGSAKKILRKGDVIKCPPNVPHWHGASPDEIFVQTAINTSEAGPTVWLQAVSKSEYEH